MESRVLEGKWYVLYTQNKQERQARESLPYASVVPMLERKVVRMIDGKKHAMVELEPKYPNYVFIQHDGSKDFFETCLRNRAVVNFAGGEFDPKHGRVPIPMSASDVERIFAREIVRDLQIGELVYVIDGPYKDQVGEIKERHDGYCLVAIKVFNVVIKERIPEEFLTRYGTGS